MVLKTIKELKEKLKNAMDSQDIKKFESLVYTCPLSSRPCISCLLFDEGTPGDLDGSLTACILGSMRDIYYNHLYTGVDEETTLPRLLLEGVKLLYYLESKE